jgi:hypothetical protein
MQRVKTSIWKQLRALLVASCLLLAMGQSLTWAQESDSKQDSTTTPGQSPTDLPNAPAPAPGETQKSDPGPMQQIEDRSRQAAQMTGHLATSELIRARNWESTWIEGVFVPVDQPRLTLTGKQRRQIYLRQTLTTPGAYMKRMFGAGIDQARGVPSQWDDGWGGFAERFASREGQFITANTLAALGNAKLGYEVRYDQCKCEGLWPRTKHAFLRNLLTYDRSEGHLRPQWALYGGAFGGGVISTVWKPSPKNAFANGGWAVLGQLGYGTLLNFVTEFSREINRKQGVRP